jgi:hypothetical protein
VPIITKELLDELLNPTNKNAGASFTASYRSQGPSYLDTWLFMEGEDCWQQRSAAPLAISSKKIIFSNSLLKERAPKSLDLDLMSALIEHYQVYLWPGSNTALPVEPLSCSAEFWERLDSCHPASQRGVEEGLAQQGCSTAGYIILDHVAYNGLFKECYNSINGGIVSKATNINTLDVNELGGAVTLERIKEFVDVTQITAIGRLAPTTNELDVFLQFPNLKTIVIKQPSFLESSENYLKKLAGHHLMLVLADVKSNEWLKMPTTFKAIHVTGAPDVKVLEFASNDSNRLKSDSDGNLLKCLIIDDCKNLQKLNLENCRKLRHLQIKNADSLHKIDVGQLQDLGFLEIDCNNLHVLNIEKCTKLKHFSIDSREFKGVDFSRLTNLEDLKINQCQSSLTLNSKNFQKLRRLSLGAVALEKTHLSQFPNLEYLSIRRKNLDKLNKCKKLKYINISNVGDSEIDLSPLPDLESLSISSCTGLRVLKIEKCRKLKKLTISYAPNLEKIDCSLPPDLEELNVGICTELRGLEIKDCQKLKHVTIFMTKIQEIDFGNLQNLENLTIDFRALNLKNCRKLKSLTVYDIPLSNFKDCQKLRSIDTSNNECNISHWQDLEELAINKSKNLTIENCQKLKRLKINDCAIQTIDFFHLQNLEELEIEDCQDLQELNLENCRKLKRLTIKNCNIQLQKINFVCCSELESLVISLEESHTELFDRFVRQALGQGQNYPLPRTTAMHCPSAIDLSQLPKLKTIAIVYPSAIDINLSHATKLRELTIAAHEVKLQLAECTKLQMFSLDGREDAHVQHLKDCKQLRSFKLSVPKVESFAQLTHCLPHDCEVRLVKSSYWTSNPRRQHLQNETSPVSIFSLGDDGTGVDADTTSKKQPHCASGKLSVTLKTAHNVSRHDYRTIIFDQVEMKSSHTIRFTSQKSGTILINKTIPSFTDNDIASLSNDVACEQGRVLAFFTGQLEPRKRYALATLQAMSNQEITVYCRPQNAVQLFWHPAHQQYYVQLQSSFFGREVELLYCFKENLDYEEEASGHPVVQKGRKLLPAELIKALQPLRSHPGLSFLFNDSIDLEEKTRLLITYCHFIDEPLTTCPKGASDIEKLLCSIQERKGVCRHNSKAFMLLARCFLGIPVRMVFNELHAFTEIPYVSQVAGEDKWCWRRVNLGGGSVLDITPAEARQNKFLSESVLQEAEQRRKLTSLSAKNLAENPETLKSAQQEDAYCRQFIALAQKSELQSVASLMERKLLSPLIELASDQDPLRVNTCIRQQLKTHPIDLHAHYLYIHRPKDFTLFLEPYQLTPGGQRNKVKGPLDNLIRDGGLLVVNWSNFTPTEIACYKSILDTEPTLLGQPVSKHVRVIGLTNSGTESCAAFLSRCQRYALPPGFLKIQPLTTEYVAASTSKNPKPQEIDLFHRLSWREKLLGKITFKGDQILLENGVLASRWREIQRLSKLSLKLVKIMAQFDYFYSFFSQMQS